MWGSIFSSYAGGDFPLHFSAFGFQNASQSTVWEPLQTAILSGLKRQYLNNDYFAGGIGLMFIGLLSKVLIKCGRLIFGFLMSTSSTSIEIGVEDEAFEWMKEWLSSHMGHNVLQLKLHTKHDDDEDGTGNSLPSCRNQGKRPKLLYVPQLRKTQKVKFRGQMIAFQIQKARGISKSEGCDSPAQQLLDQVNGKEELVLWGNSRETLEEVVKEAMNDYYNKDNPRKISIKRWNSRDNYWEYMTSKIARSLESVILEINTSMRLVEDIKKFFGSAEWYLSHGIPHRRGYLLFGPPGCGKSSLIEAIAGDLSLEVAFLSLSSKEMSDDMIHSAMNSSELQGIVVLEDIDAAFKQRDQSNERNSLLSFSGLLNAIDGIAARNGRVLIMTTNHVEKLDPALVRPDRVDMRLFLGLATHEQIKMLFLKFFSDASEEEAQNFANRLPDRKISPASLQGYFLLHRDDKLTAMKSFGELIQQCNKANEEDHQAKSANNTKLQEGEGAPSGHCHLPIVEPLNPGEPL